MRLFVVANTNIYDENRDVGITTTYLYDIYKTAIVDNYRPAKFFLQHIVLSHYLTDGAC